MTVPEQGQLSPDLLRGLTSRRISRRSALRLGGLAAVGSVLAGCGIQGTGAGSGTFAGAERARDRFWAAQKKTGQLDFANWPLYIDVGKGNDHPSLDLFTKRTGISVTYSEVIQDDPQFYGKIQPELSSGQSTGYDLAVITNGTYLDLLMQQDYLIPLDQSRMTNFYKYAGDLVKDPSYDRGNVFTMAWQSGITGIGYNPKYVHKEITSWTDLLDPKFAGHIGMFGDNQDLPNAALCAIGVNPETSTPSDWQKAADWLKKQRPLVRKYYDQGYIGALQRGDLWVTMAWSGDIFIANSSGGDLKFIVPKEGAPIWTDNMCIPAHAQHPLDAMIYMDFVYQPQIAAMLADYINYMTPVPATKQIFAKEAKQATDKKDKQYYENLSTSPLIFPSAHDLSRLYRYRVLSAAEQKQWNNLFEPIYQS